MFFPFMTESSQERGAPKEVKPFIFYSSSTQVKGLLEKYAAWAWSVRFDIGDFNTHAFLRLYKSSDWEAM